MYRVLHIRSNITTSFAENLPFPEWMTFTHALWVGHTCTLGRQKPIKIKTIVPRHYTFWKYYLQDQCNHQRSNISASLTEHVKVQEKMTFIHALWLNTNKSKQKITRKRGHYTFWKCYLQDQYYHQRSNISASFTEHLKVQEKMTFIHALWVNTNKSKQKITRKSRHYTFWKCYIQGLRERKKLVLHMQFV